jgi:eukaryotic-like serine/threonine-protein kinase
MVERTKREGQRVGNYRLGRLLGEGGFAEVYLAEHIYLNTQAAVKLLLTQLANEDVEGFRNEARMIAGLVHPHIVRVLDFGVEARVPYLAMDYAPNGTLRQRHPKETRLPLQLVVSYVQQIAGALQYAHEQHLVHRDIKPENMLVGRNNEVLLSDFGIALVAQSSQYQHTQNVAGTVAYMAPEQLQAHPRPASDQYSLGIVVYEWLGGQRPFQGTMTEIAVKHATATPPSLRFLTPDLPYAVEQVVMMALQKDPLHRFPTILAFAQALEQASGQQSQQFTDGSGPTVLSEPPINRLPFAPLPQIQPAAYPQPPQIAPPPPQMQALSPYGSVPSYIDHSGHPTPLISSQPYPAYPSYSPSQISSPPLSFYPTQTGQPLPLQKNRRVSRRTAIVALAVGAIAVAGSGVAYYAYSASRNLQKGSTGVSSPTNLQQVPTGVSTQPGSTEGPSSSPVSSSAAPPALLMTFSDHTDTVESVSWSSDGKYIASASNDGTSHVWDVSTQQRVLSYRSDIQPAKNDDSANAVAWLPNSTRIAVGFSDGTAQIADITSHQQVGFYDSTVGGDLPGVLYGVAVSPNGQSLALAGFFSDDIQIFDVATQRRIQSLTGHTDVVHALAWSHNGRYIASGSYDGTVRVWNASSGKLLLIYSKHNAEVLALSWSPDDSRIISSAFPSPTYIWASDTGQTLLTYGSQDDFPADAIAWSHNGKYIASSGGSDGNAHLWDPQSGQPFRTIAIDGSINSISWSPDDSRIVVASDKIVQVWQI